MASGKIFAVIFVTALVVRLANAPMIVGSGRPHLTPLDDLYHWKRIAFSAAHFPAVLEFDPDRGERGAYCPWPPLYDLTCGAVARVLGMRAIVWIPPLLGAIAAAVAAFFVGRVFGSRAAIAAGVALAMSPFIVTESSVGDIDHHFLEWPLAFAILGAACLLIRRRSWIPLAIVMTVAMFVQTAMLVACGLAFVVVIVFTDGRSAAIAFSITAAAIALYRITRPPDFPNSPWFLGWPHAALFAGAAAVCLLRKKPAFAALIAVTVAVAFHSAIAGGSHFFGGDPWLSTISEFQPVWKGNLDDWTSHAAGFAIGAILVWDLARRAIRGRDKVAGAIVIFALAYFPLAISSRRFEATAIPLLALAGAVDAAMILRRNAAMFAASAVALIPAVQLGLWMMHPLPPISNEQAQWIRAADFLKSRPPGRVLAPWSLGHCLDVLGEHPVIVDNFGTMPDAGVFDRANQALHSDDLTAYCERIGVRYVIRQKLPGPRFRLVYSAGLNIWEYVLGR
jgi:asparagine N-glycosylation enzyme membrane subunit Stt3